MAKYTMAYSCGHEMEVTLYGPYRERERKLKWAKESGLCPDCYWRAQAKAFGFDELPALDGSDKQIAWAEKIRKDFLKEIFRTPDAIRDRYDLPMAKRIVAERIDAKWWIENRFDPIRKADAEVIKI